MTVEELILIATDNPQSAAQIRQLLSAEFDHIAVSSEPAHAAADFEAHRPAVLVLAFDGLDKAERYYDAVCRDSSIVQIWPHKTLILCAEHDLAEAYALCKKEQFNDYIQFWPESHDTMRLPMAVHHALRLLGQTKALFTGNAAAAAAPPPGARVLPLVLVVDDDTFQHELLATMLGDALLELAFATSAAEALASLRVRRPDLILMDVQMPGIDGVQATRGLKSTPPFAGIPVVMITGRSDKDVVVDSLKAGAVDFVVKPFDKDALVAKVRKHIHRGGAAA